MTSKEREYIGRLKRRKEWLANRAAYGEDKFVHWDKAEFNALEWAIDFIEGALGANHD